MRIVTPTLLATVFALSASAVAAGPVSDFEAALRGVYGQYRVALFASNMGNAEKSAAAIAAFQAGWADLATTVPNAPQYQDDTAVPGTFAAVADHAAKAAEATKAGDLTEAHEVLEAIRVEIGALHMRNGIFTFSDRMNAYHAAMEEVLATDPAALDPSSIATLAEKSAVLGYLAGQIADQPAPEAADPAYAALAEAFQTSVANLIEAVRSGEAAAIKPALAALKPAYSKFFLQFG